MNQDKVARLCAELSAAIAERTEPAVAYPHDRTTCAACQTMTEQSKELPSVTRM